MRTFCTGPSRLYLRAQFPQNNTKGPNIGLLGEDELIKGLNGQPLHRQLDCDVGTKFVVIFALVVRFRLWINEDTNKARQIKMIITSE